MSRTSILALTRYDRTGASSRVRLLQYIANYHQGDITFTVSPLLSDQYICDLYSNRGMNYIAIIIAYLRRIRLLSQLGKYDVIWIEKEILPFAPAWVEKLIYKNCVRVILDYDDAIFLNYKNHRCGLIRILFGRKIDVIVNQADIVTVGNHYLEQYAIACGARDVRILPSVVDITKYQFRRDRQDGEFRIGWIGTPSTQKYLAIVAKALQELAKQHSIKLVVIGAEDIHISGVTVETVAWSESTEANYLQGLDIGIMPLFTTDWEKGKCGYKLIQYMACGLPVVATRYGANIDIIEQGREGFLVNDNKQWVAAIRRLIENRELYKDMSLSARDKAERSYSIQSQRECFMSLFLN